MMAMGPMDGDTDRVGMNLRLLAERRLLEAVVEPFLLHDLQRLAEPLIVRAKAEEPADDRLVGAMAFAGPREGAVQLDEGPLGGARDEIVRDESQPAGSRRVA